MASDELKYCEKMGYDSVINGANTTNCNFRIFSTKEKMRAWERGVKRAKHENDMEADNGK